MSVHPRTPEHTLAAGDNPAAGTHRDERTAYFDALAGEHDYWRGKHRAYYDTQTAMLKRLVPKGLRVLELGCATGDTLAALEPSYGVGVDLSDNMLSIAKAKHPHLDFQQANVEGFEWHGEPFDVVIMADLVGELNDLWAAFRNLRGLVHADTRVIVTYYNFLWQPAIEFAQKLGIKRPQVLQNWFTLGDVQNMFELNGFEKVTSDDGLLFPLPVPFVSHLANRYFSALPAVREMNLLQVMVARPGPAFHVKPEPMSVSVIVPAKNERGNIRAAIRRTPMMGTHTELIFVEGGSSDGTRDEIMAAMQDEPTDLTLKFVPQPGKGKYDAVRAGFAEATGDVLMILDADLTVMPEDLPRFYLALAEKRGEFINGCRLVYPMEDQAMRHLNLIANKFFGSAFTYVLGQRLKDTLCGTKVFRRTDFDRIEDNRDVFGDFDPFGDFDMLFGAANLGMKITEIPVRYKARTYGETQISRFRHGLILFKMLGVATRHFKLK